MLGAELRCKFVLCEIVKSVLPASSLVLTDLWVEAYVPLNGGYRAVSLNLSVTLSSTNLADVGASLHEIRCHSKMRENKKRRYNVICSVRVSDFVPTSLSALVSTAERLGVHTAPQHVSARRSTDPYLG